MTPMQKQNVKVNIYDLKYPCYISGIPKDSKRILHIPGEIEFKNLDNVLNYVIEAYKTEDQIFVFDVIPLTLWRKNICQLPYEKRLKYVRVVVTSQIAAFDKVMDLPTVLVDNPIELQDYCDSLVDGGMHTARIMDTDGYYVFGECVNGEYLEMEL